MSEPIKKSRNAPVERTEFNELKKKLEKLEKQSEKTKAKKAPRKLSDYNKFMSTEMAKVKKENPDWAHDKVFAETVTRWNATKE